MDNANNEYVYDLYDLVELNNKHTYYDVRHSKKQTRHILFEKVKVVKSYYLDSKLPEEEHVVYKDFTISCGAWNQLKLFEHDTFSVPSLIYST